MFIRNTIRISALLLLGSASLMAPAQSKRGQLKAGDKAFENLAYSKAVEHYLKFQQANPRHTQVMEKLGDCFRLTSKPMQAEEWYAKAVDASPQIVRFHYATALMQNERFDAAAAQFKKYLENNPSDKLAQRRYNSCLNYRKFYATQGKYDVKDAGVNTETADFCPLPAEEGKVLLSSNRTDSDLLFAWLDNSFLDLYLAKDENGTRLVSPVKLKGGVNSKYHEAAASFSPGGDSLYFTRNNFHNGRARHDEKGTLLLQTYMAVKKGKGWGGVTKLAFNNDNYSTGHPAILPDGNHMIIVSDMPGGYGGTDLYLVERQGAGWGPLVNMGPTVNTEGTEMFPWVSQDGTLFFASDGHEGLGGLDIFMTKPQGKGWTQPENLGYPVNTSMDDFSLCFNAEGTTGYLASNRSGGKGDDDVYMFTVRRQVVVEVVDALTRKPIEGAVTTLLLDGEQLGISKSDAAGRSRLFAEGTYTYEVEADASGYRTGQAVVEGDLTNPLEEAKVVVALNPIQECAPTAYLDGSIFTDSMPLPPGATVTIREKSKELVITPGQKFGYEVEVGKDYVVEVKVGEGPPKVYEVATGNAKPNDTLDLLVDIKPMKENLGKVFYIIYYNFDKHDIREDASAELDQLVAYMKKYPSIVVEMGSHTDSRGTQEYNMELSRNRAVDAHAYIVAHGIDAKRISYKFFGESQPTNACTDTKADCTEEEHQLNRRTEFRLIGM